MSLKGAYPCSMFLRLEPYSYGLHRTNSWKATWIQCQEWSKVTRRTCDRYRNWFGLCFNDLYGWELEYFARNVGLFPAWRNSDLRKEKKKKNRSNLIFPNIRKDHRRENLVCSIWKNHLSIKSWWSINWGRKWWESCREMLELWDRVRLGNRLTLNTDETDPWNQEEEEEITSHVALIE